MHFGKKNTGMATTNPTMTLSVRVNENSKLNALDQNNFPLFTIDGHK
jgi:hypothetical protein